MSIPYLSDMPAAIASTDAGEPLVIKVDALIAAMPTLVTEANALATWNETRAGESATSASNASTSASGAATSASNASTSDGEALASANTAEAAITAITDNEWGYDNVSLNVGSYDTRPSSVYVSPDGHHLFIVGYASDKVHQFSLPTSNSLTGAIYVGFYSVAAQDTTPHGLTFSPDGTRMFVCGLDSDKVWQYNLATPWVITSGVTVAGSVAVAPAIDPNGVCIIGSRMYVSRWSIIYQYTLTAGDYDITGGVTGVGSFSTAAYGNNHDVVVLPSGDTMYTADITNNVIHQWALTDFDVTSAVHVRSFSVVTQGTLPTGMCFSASGEKLFVVDSVADKIFQYSTSPGLPSKTGHQGKALRVNATEDGILWSGAKAIGDTVVSVNAAERQPPEWLECDGSSFSSATYPALYAVLGTTTLPNIDLGGYPFTKVYIQTSF